MILHRTSGPEDWKAHLAQPELHWKPRRSAMETALAWEAQAELPPELAALFPGQSLVQAIVEYPVSLPGGTQDSFNDVFALLAGEDGLTACMVEAKRDESFGPTLEEWIAKETPGKRRRLTMLCATLGLDTSDLPGSLRYQLLHRTASAILTAKRYRSRDAAMVVQSFSPTATWFDDFAIFVRAMGGTPLRDGLSHLPQRDDGVTLALGWASAAFRTPEIEMEQPC